MCEIVESVLRKFDVDIEYGFVLRDPLTRLPLEYEQWSKIIDELPELLESGKLDEVIDDLPLISTESLSTDRELRLAHLVLCTLAAAVVWNRGADRPRLSIPQQIATPLLEVCNRIGFKPIVVHASACLANWKRKEGTTGWKAEDMDLIAFRFLRHEGNAWFFTITAQIETEFATALVAIVEVCLSFKSIDYGLLHIQESLAKAQHSLNRMKEHLPPVVFYKGFRQFLSGYTSDKFELQGGIIFEGHSELGPQWLNGGSAAQSSTLHVIDTFIYIDHHGKNKEFLDNQRNYMPPKHRAFIDWVSTNRPSKNEIISAPNYEKTLIALQKFRTDHIKLVTNFIVLQAAHNDEKIGTGGTSFMTLLKEIRDDC
ncbi:hypothetical protein AB6A40_002452 [Gnathostoma spinigerum]|uniref:Indoleamine 2,3-dioxygenase n=1 Tax=Gnathostoma spinigerum TaxID=75299 RepID=A0ABD6E6L3_9BILA